VKNKVNEMAHGVYVHVPFCKQKCIYCDFFSKPNYSADIMEQYGVAVAEEIAVRSQEAGTLAEDASIYFGGGTPSILPVSALSKIVSALKKQGFWSTPVEATIECNPGMVDAEKLLAYRELGFDRISFGIQSFNDVELKTIGRIHNSETALESMELAKKAGFKRINGDLIYGLPGQTLASLQSNLEKICALDLDHISVYGLILEEGTPLSRLVTAGQLALPSEELTDRMYDLVMGYLPHAGYERYEISNFAKAGGYSQHNLVYWNYQPYLGFGAGATGFDGLRRRKGVGNIQEYLANSLSAETEVLTAKDIFSEYLFMNLRKKSGVSFSEFQRRYQGVLPDFDFKTQFAQVKQKLQDTKFAELVKFHNDDKVVLTDKGMALGNVVFLECLIE